MAYPGGKAGSGVFHKLINLMPPHERYVELFLGGGAVLRNKRPAAESLGVDLSAAALATFGDAGLPDSLATSDDAQSTIAENSDAAGLRYSLAKSGEGRSSIPNLTLCRADALKILATDGAAWGPETLIYADPPYVRSARRSPKPMYDFEMSDDDHCCLLRLLLASPAMAMVSGYHCPLYDDLLAGWRFVDFTAMTRRGPATETVWMNFPEPLTLHDYRYLGDGFRERERIRRKQRRWENRLRTMPTQERYALLSVLSTLARNGVTAVTPDIAMPPGSTSSPELTRLDR